MAGKKDGANHRREPYKYRNNGLDSAERDYSKPEPGWEINPRELPNKLSDAVHRRLDEVLDEHLCRRVSHQQKSERENVFEPLNDQFGSLGQGPK